MANGFRNSRVHDTGLSYFYKMAEYEKYHSMSWTRAFTSLQNEKTDINLCKANNSTIGKRSKICSKLTSYFTSYSSVPIVDFEPTKNLSDIHIHALIRR